MKTILLALLFGLTGCNILPPLARLSDDAVRAAAPSIAPDEKLLFRGHGSVRLNSVSGTIAGSELLITDKTIVAMAGGGRSGVEPISVASFKRADIVKVTNDYLSFISIQTRDGNSHWLDVGDGRKREVVSLLNGG